MKLNLRQTYPCTPDQFWKMYWDPSFDEALQEGATVDREILEQTDRGATQFRRMKFVPHADLPSAIARVAGTKKFIYEQENVWHKESGRMDWKVLPSLMADKINAAGHFTITEAPNGCVMTITGDISVNVRFIGGQIEKQVVSMVEEGYAKMLATAKTWLQANT